MTQPITPDEMIEWLDNWMTECQHMTEDKHPPEMLSAIRDFIQTHSREGWQPIDTAPKDGTVILAYVEGRLKDTWHDVIRYDVDAMAWFSGITQVWPSHWMPLPAAPEPKEDDNDQ